MADQQTEIARCPRDGQTAAYHLAIGGTHPNGSPRTNGEFIGCDFGAEVRGDCWLCTHTVVGSTCSACGCMAHYPPHQRVEVCVHCGDTVTNPPPGDWWTHARRAPDGALHTGKSRCQSPDVAYGHLAHPADVPCRADGPNPCLGATYPPGMSPDGSAS